MKRREVAIENVRKLTINQQISLPLCSIRRFSVENIRKLFLMAYIFSTAYEARLSAETAWRRR